MVQRRKLYDRDLRQTRLMAAAVLCPGWTTPPLWHGFLRVDFCEIDGAPRFGEFCLYAGCGLDRFANERIDLELGGLWHDARGDGGTIASVCRKSIPEDAEHPMDIRMQPAACHG